MNKEKEVFEVIGFKVLIESRQNGSIEESICEATVKLKVGQEMLHTVAEGNGPVNALDNALRKALYSYGLEQVILVSYHVNSTNGFKGTAAPIKVSVYFFDGKNKWMVEKESTDVINASFRALVEGLQIAICNFTSSIYDG